MITLVANIGKLVTATGDHAVGGAKQGVVTELNDAWIAMDGAMIAAVGTGKPPAADACIDAGGALVTAGLVDAHTHLVFGGWRAHELDEKLRGASYLDILNAGGGILSTVRDTRAASEDALFLKARRLTDEMLRYGTTALEAKSGYGLDLQTELKQLRVIRRLREEAGCTIAATYLGAHALPKEYALDREGYLALLQNVVLPAVASEGLAEYCDVFCETGVFDANESRAILKKAASLGLGLKIHSDEIDAIGGTELAGELHAVSAEHLAVTTPRGVAALKEGGTIACLLPATSFYLCKGCAPARAFLDAGVPVAVASDFNPGSTPNLNLQFAMSAACFQMRMTPAEVLTAVTLNAAAAMGKADTIGTIEAGKRADLVLWDVDTLPLLLYRYGSNRVRAVIRGGRIVCTA